MVHPQLPKEKTYVQLEEALKLRFKTRVSYFRKRTNFDRLCQNNNEPVSNWYTRVRENAAECNFGTSIQERIKDKFVAGLKLGPIHERVCEESVDKDLSTLLEIALQKESVLNQDRPTVNKIEKKDNRNKILLQKSQNDKILKCYHCGKGNHNFSKCKYKTYKCKKCKRIGHLADICKSKSTHTIDIKESEQENQVSVDIFSTSVCNNINYISPFMIECKINDKPIHMELDTGAAVSCIPRSQYDKCFSKSILLEPSNVELKTYSGEIIKPEGKINILLKINNKEIKCPLLVIKNGSKCLLGRDLIKKFGIQDLLTLNSVENTTLESLLKEYSEVFKPELGVIKGEEVKLELINDDVKPIFSKPHPIPHSFKDKVNKELQKLEKEGVIVKTENSKWGTPLVPVIKENGNLRLCANYKITVNKYLKDVNHPLPRIEDIFTALQGGEKFTKLDLRNAFNQLLLHEQTGELLAWSTPKGIYKLTRLPYGTKPASAIFQVKMEKILLGVKGVVNFIDDVVVTGANDRDHLENLREVLKKFKDVGIRLNKDKCLFFQPQIKYLGHIISKHGLNKDFSKLEAITNAPIPKNVTEVRSWIGMVNYYSKFIPNVSIKLKPVYELLKKNSQFVWTKECQNSFNTIKKDIISDNVLVHFDRSLPIRLACDASQNGIGAVLSHIMPDGTDRPISFISRVFTKAEEGYSMIHKEALAIYWSVQKFYQYLVGTKFELLSDHKPLQALFGEHKSLPQMAAGRLQRWSLYLAGFDYIFKHVKGCNNVKADCMSRLPLNSDKYSDKNDTEYDYINFVEEQNMVDLNVIRSETRKDSILSSVFNMIRYGFPKEVKSECLKPFFQRKDELYIERGIIMWGYRVVIPFKLQNNLLKELHSTHEGIVKMKTNARSYFWWPNLDKCIENVVRNCNLCMSARPEPVKSNIISWPKTKMPYERVHADFLGPINGKMVLIIIDSYSKWPEAFVMKNLDSKSTVEKFRECFSRYGLPKIVVTDNATTFCSKEFSEFLFKNGIKHETSPPFHPATNGFAENAVKNFKFSISKTLKDKSNYNVSFETLINRYLFHYRNSIHVITGVTPSQLMFQRKLRTRFDLLNNTYSNDLKVKDKGGRNETFIEGEYVYCRDYRNPNKKVFTKCVIDEVLGERTYLCKVLDEGIIWKRHLDQIIRSLPPENLDTNVTSTNNFNDNIVTYNTKQNVNSPYVSICSEDNSDKGPIVTEVEQTDNKSNDKILDNVPEVSIPVKLPVELDKPEIRRSQRIIKPPKRLNL